jgi:hypothetical protein
MAKPTDTRESDDLAELPWLDRPRDESHQSGCCPEPGCTSRGESAAPGWLAIHAFLCNVPHMATNLAIDDRLLDQALKVGGHKTKKATVTEALTEYIQRRKQRRIVELFGAIDVDPAYDYKAQRRRR